MRSCGLTSDDLYDDEDKDDGVLLHEELLPHHWQPMLPKPAHLKA
jgi:hypothetical protein